MPRPPAPDSSCRPVPILLGAAPRTVPSALLFENRSLLAIDKPAGWMLSPRHWTRTSRSLQAALEVSLQQRPPWVRTRRLAFLRFVHRLDADTTGLLLLAKSRGAVQAYSRLFQERRVLKGYLAIVEGEPPSPRWTSRKALARDPRQPGRMRPARSGGAPAETAFRVVAPALKDQPAVVMAYPLTGRTHQVRVHLYDAGCPVVGDPLYGTPSPRRPKDYPLGLRAAFLRFRDPFERRRVAITAPLARFLMAHGLPPNLDLPEWESPQARPRHELD